MNPARARTRPLTAFERRWTLGIRWFLLGGGVLFIVESLVWEY